MNALYYAFFLLGAACTLAISLLSFGQGGQMISSKPWYRKPIVVLGFTALVGYAGLAITGYVDNRQSKQQTQRLETNVKSLSDQSGALEKQTRTLEEQNRALTDQIGDCNARMEALGTKFHVPAHLRRGSSEKATTSDSITTTRKR